MPLFHHVNLGVPPDDVENESVRRGPFELRLADGIGHGIFSST
jgi:hypothetical protein